MITDLGEDVLMVINLIACAMTTAVGVVGLHGAASKLWYPLKFAVIMVTAAAAFNAALISLAILRIKGMAGVAEYSHTQLSELSLSIAASTLLCATIAYAWRMGITVR